MRKFLQKILKILAKLAIKKYKPEVIGITGSVGKTSTKEAIFSVLKTKFSVRKSEKNYNNEIGVPLTILGMESPKKSFFGWLGLFFRGVKLFLIRDKNYPEILILEMAADKIGDINYLTSIVQPKVGVITAVAPVHLEFFKSLEAIAKEKSVLVKNLFLNGLAVLNTDDEAVYLMKDLTRSPVMTYGFSEKADIKASDISCGYEFLENKNELGGIHFKVEYEGKSIPFFLSGILGKHQIYAALAAITVGIYFKINLLEISESLKKYQSPPGRMKLIKGIKNTFIIDDSYNSSPRSCEAALDTLKEIPNQGRKFAVLGDMLELGKYSEEAHFKIGEKIAEIAGIDFLVCVGEKSRDILRGAKKGKMAEENMFYFSKTEEAGKFLQDKIRENDILLIKGSQGVRMEKIVKELMAEPLKAKELLVRQDESWVS